MWAAFVGGGVPHVAAATYTVSGRVLENPSSTNIPVAGAQVRVCWGPPPTNCATSLPTAADGTYSLTFTTPSSGGVVTLSAIGPAGGIYFNSGSINRSPSAAFTQNFALTKGERVNVNVTNPDGSPAAAFFYACEYEISGGTGCGILNQLVASFTKLVHPSAVTAYSVGIYDPNNDYAVIVVEGTSVTAGVTTNYDVQFQPGNTVKGVVSSNGIAVGSANVSYQGPTSMCPPRCGVSDSDPRTTSDASGAFELRQLPAGSQRIAVYTGTSTLVQVDAGGTTVCNVDVAVASPACASVSGIVTESLGSPVENATVTMRGPSPATTTVTTSTDAAGRYAFPAGAVVDGGEYTVAVDPPIGRSDLASVTAPALTADFGQPMLRNVTLPSGDSDGVDSATEDGAPNGGDGNGDGIADSEQANVASLPNVIDAQYVTVAAPAGTSLRSVTSSAAASPPAGSSFPYGLVGFELLVPGPGDSALVTVHLPSDALVNSYYKYQGGVWTDVTSQVSIVGNQVAMTLVDGGFGDQDGVANGVIVDPGGPALRDVTPPVITPVVNGTLGENGWYTSDVQVSWTVTDGESAISSTQGCASATLTADTAGTTLTCSAESGGGSASSSLTVKIDATAPTVQGAVSPDPVLLHGIASAVSGATDETSGVTFDSCGTPSTMSVGEHHVTCVATDAAGNTTTADVSYRVVYGFVGFSSPLDNAPVVNVATAGRAIPLKWRLIDANGAAVTDLTGITLRVVSLVCDLGTTADQIEEYAAGASGLQNLGNGYYQTNWKVPSTYARSCKTLELHLGEGAGTQHIALFRFTK